MLFIYTKFNKTKGYTNKKVVKGSWALQALDYGVLSEKHINFLKCFLSKKYKQFKVYYTLNNIYTKKPLETRMGGGKGIIYKKVFIVTPGHIVVEIYGVCFNLIYISLKEISYKLSIKLRLIKLI